MPRVTSYGQRKVRTEATPFVRVETRQAQPTAAAFGATKGAAIADFGATAVNVGGRLLSQQLQIHAQQRDLADRVAVQEADNQLAQWEATRLYDPNSGAFAVKGKAALDLPNTVEQEYKEFAGTLAQGLTNDRQKLAFQDVQSRRWTNMFTSLEKHAGNELTAWQAEESAKGIANATDAGIVAIGEGDLNRSAQEFAIGRNLVVVHAQAVGMGKEATKAELDAYSTKFHAGAIDRLLAQNKDKAAQVYYEEAKDQISGAAQARIEKALKEGSTRGEAQRQSDAIIAAGGTLTEQRDKAKAIDDPDVRDLALQYIEHDHSIRAAEARANEEDLMVTAGNLIDKGGIKAVPSNLWVKLTPGQKTSLEQYAKRNLQGGDGETNLGTYDALNRLMTGDPQKFSETNLLLYRAKLSKGDFKHFSDLQRSVRAGDGKATPIIATEGQRSEIVNGALRGMGLDPAPPEAGVKGYDKAKTEKVELFRRKVRDAITAFENQTPGKPQKAGIDDVERIVDTLIVQTAKAQDRWFFDPRGDVPATRGFESGYASSVADIPASVLRQIDAALKDSGQSISDAARLRLFNAYLDSVRR